MNSKRWLTGASMLFVLAMLAACGGGGGDGSTAAPPPENSAPPPDNVAGFAYVANESSDNVSAYTINATTGELSEVAGSPFAAGSWPTSVSVHPSGKFAYVANGGSEIVPGNISAYTIDAATGALSEVTGSPFAGSSPQSIHVDPSGKFAYVANGSVISASVSAYSINSGTGVLSEVAGSPFAAGDGPVSVTVDPSGRFVYVANFSSTDVSAYTIDAATGMLSEVAGSPFTTGSPFGAGGFGTPYSIAVDPSGKFAYVAKLSGFVSAYGIDAGTGALSEIAGSPFAAVDSPISTSITVHPSGRFAYLANSGPPFADTNNVSSYTINAATGALTIGAAVAAGDHPISVTVDASGRFAYVANQGSRGTVGRDGNVSAYTINATTGALSEVAGSPFVAGTNPRSVTTTRKIQ